MSRRHLDAVAEIKDICPESARVAMLLHRIVLAEGERVISLDRDGKVFATPPANRLSRKMMAAHSDCVVGQYKPGATAAHIREDLIATWDEQRGRA